jgi:hypothetical protein
MPKAKPTTRRVKSRHKPPRVAPLPIESWCETTPTPSDARKRSVHVAIACLGQLVALRALEDGISRTTAWLRIFDLERLHADLDSDDSRRRDVAERALGAIAVMLLRHEIANATGKVRLLELASLLRLAANEEIARVAGPPGLVPAPN